MAGAKAGAKVLTAAEIEAADDRKIEEVVVPEWGGVVFVRSMTAKERELFEDALPTDKDGNAKAGLLRAYWVAACCCDDKGELLFSPDKAAALGGKSAAAIARIADAAVKLNRAGKGAIEDEKKDSAATPSEGSPTGSA